MRPVIAWPVAVVLAILSVTAYLNGEAVNKWVEDNSISVANVDAGPLVGITNNIQCNNNRKRPFHSMEEPV